MISGDSMHETGGRHLIAALALVATAAAGCAPAGSEAAERRQDTTGRRDSIAAAAAASMSEAQVLGLLAASNSADSALGALGAARGSSPEVKEFGRMILREHHALRAEAMGLGRQLGIAVDAPRVPPDEPPAAATDALARVEPGPAWDRAYLDYSVAAHQAAFENAARALAATHRPEIRQLIDRSVPIVQKHLDKARTLQRMLSAARPDTVKGRVPSAAAKGKPLR